MSPAPLIGITVALAETRELDRMATILEADGATVVRCPLVSILDAPDAAPVDAWLNMLIAGGFDDLIFLTGEGLRRLLSRSTVLGVHDDVVAALGKCRRITRGPKPARALHEIKLAADIPTPNPTSQGIMETLSTHDLNGRRVGVQLYGTEPNVPLVRFLEGAGATVHTVAPYIYAPSADDSRVVALIDDMAAGRIQVMTFTSAAQVDRLWNVAEERKLPTRLAEAMRRTKLAAIGPIAAEALEDRGVTPDIVPEEPFVIKRLTNAIAQAMRPGG